ncbi:hypothetical protein DH26_gp032 [Chloriridovirus anopheles1]|uniref:Uncharacterized protein n=1 Tax=Chloriridovirus anopheles1 TaxID=1465751 RepID=W8QEZ9_9VIRU|nr:hypothetical protein DH26_gp032 [Anopheles minimus iridovirus]AHL67529.1 hypothetical protein AMIV_032 [Anopheles minimus iridovirus]
MLQQTLKIVIETKVLELVDFILAKHPNVPKAEIMRKVKMLNLMVSSPLRSNRLLKNLSEKKKY